MFALLLVVTVCYLLLRFVTICHTKRINPPEGKKDPLFGRKFYIEGDKNEVAAEFTALAGGGAIIDWDSVFSDALLEMLLAGKESGITRKAVIPSGYVAGIARVHYGAPGTAPEKSKLIEWSKKNGIFGPVSPHTLILVSPLIAGLHGRGKVPADERAPWEVTNSEVSEYQSYNDPDENYSGLLNHAWVRFAVSWDAACMLPLCHSVPQCYKR